LRLFKTHVTSLQMSTRHEFSLENWTSH